MHNNFYLLRQLVLEQTPILKGGVISACFSQNKEELIVRIEQGKQSYYIKANLEPSFSCLSFPEEFHRARRNSIDLFPECIGLVIQELRYFENERSIALELNLNYTLLFKMHGNRSNAILFYHDTPQFIFRKNLEADLTLHLSTLDRSIEWNEAVVGQDGVTIKKHFYTFGKIIWNELEEEGFFQFSEQQKWQRLLEIKQVLENPTYYITRWKNTIVLSLIKTGIVISTTRSPAEALSTFCQEFLQTEAFDREKLHAIQHLTSTLSACTNYLEKAWSKVHEVEKDRHYKVWADVLMANLHAIPGGSEKIVLANFYNNNEPIEIKLKRDLSPQKNAETYYRKAKNQQIEIDRLQKAIEGKELQKATAERILHLVQSAPDLKSIRNLVNQHLAAPEKIASDEPLPYHEFNFKGFTIWVGRNAQANDLLTLKYAHKEDLWLHTKDVAGSHVVIKHQSGKPFPKDVIERAAELAAYNSKRKTESLVAVIFTPKKYVRKRKGDPAGAVVVEREEVILVEPRLSSS